MAGNPLPQGRREEVWLRDAGLCQRCGGEGTDVHHRMRRRDGGHSEWNLVLLCRPCHAWAHAHPDKAREYGYIISAYMEIEEARLVPLTNWQGNTRALT